MSLLSLVGISDVMAAETGTAAAPHAGGGLLGMLPMLIIFVLIFYFLLVRPQQKKAKNHRELMKNLSIGDEVVTSGGIVGRLAKLRDNFVSLAISKGVEITMQRSSIASVLPKGTMDSGSNDDRFSRDIKDDKYK